MLTRSMPIIEARNRLTALPEELDPENGAVVVTRRGKPVLALMSWELYDSIIETLETLADVEAMAALRRSVKELQRGKGIPWERAKKRLRL